MPQTGQSGSFKAPTNSSELQALMRQRDELRGQLSAMEDRRFQLAGQRGGLQGSMVTELDGRLKSLGTEIDRIERQLGQANDLIVAGQAKFGGQWELMPPPSPPGAPLPIGADVHIAPGIAVPPSGPMFGVPADRALLLGGAGVGFLVLGALAWVWAVRRLERKLLGRTAADPGNMTRLQQSVDAIALEVERISENQRWVTKQMNERVLGAGDAQPVNVVNAAAERVSRER